MYKHVRRAPRGIRTSLERAKQFKREHQKVDRFREEKRNQKTKKCKKPLVFVIPPKQHSTSEPTNAPRRRAAPAGLTNARDSIR